MIWTFFLRLMVATAMGAAIGLEREYHAKEAGLRTHLLVALGSCLFMILSAYAFDAFLSKDHVSFDPSRIASQVVTGIGFIGAGTIMLQKHVIRGLTTAAGLWVTAAIGLTCGSGMYVLAATATVLVLLCLEAMNFILYRGGEKNIQLTFTAPDRQGVRQVLNRLNADGIAIGSYEMKEHHDVCEVSMELQVKRADYEQQLMELLDRLNGVTILSME